MNAEEDEALRTLAAAAWCDPACPVWLAAAVAELAACAHLLPEPAEPGGDDENAAGSIYFH